MTTPYFQNDLVTLYHGDCLEITEWLEADVLITDPPYGMAYKSGRRKDLSPIIGDKDLNVRDASLKKWGDLPALVFGTWKVERPENVKQLIVWDKRGGAGFSGDLKMPWADITEEIYVFGNGWLGPRVPAIYSVPTIPNANRPDHPTPKPVGLMTALLRHVPDSWVIADPFAGSGPTLMAARNLGRQAIGVELEEKYCELIANRLSQDAFDFGGI
jgi:site-specific DNA-methyltransferase (adenine-specific)